MLALTRKKQEAIMIDGNIEIKILDIQGDKVKLGINAPKSMSVHRQEVYEQIKDANQEASITKISYIHRLNGMIKKKNE